MQARLSEQVVEEGAVLGQHLCSEAAPQLFNIYSSWNQGQPAANPSAARTRVPTPARKCGRGYIGAPANALLPPHRTRTRTRAHLQLGVVPGRDAVAARGGARLRLHLDRLGVGADVAAVLQRLGLRGAQHATDCR